MKSLRELIQDSQQDEYLDDFEFDNDDDIVDNNDDDEYNYITNEEDIDNNKILKKKMKSVYSRTLSKGVFGRYKVRDMKKMPSIYVNAPDIKLFSKSQNHQYAPGQLSNIRFQQKHPYQMNNNKSNLEIHLKYDMLQILFDECYYSKDYNGMGLVFNDMVEVMPMHLPTLIKVTDLISNISNNKTAIITLARKALPSQRSPTITQFREIEKSKALLGLFVELFAINELDADCQLYLRGQMSNPLLSASSVFLYYQSMLKLLKIIPRNKLVNILNNPMEIAVLLQQVDNVNDRVDNVKIEMNIESSDTSDSENSEQQNVHKRSRVSNNQKEDTSRMASSGSNDDLHSSLEKLAHNCLDSITINSYYIASLMSKNEHKKALKYLNEVINQFRNNAYDDSNNEFNYTKLLLQLHSIILLNERAQAFPQRLPDHNNNFFHLSKSFFLKDNAIENKAHHVYCAVLLNKLNQLPIDRVFELICDEIVKLPNEYTARNANVKTIYSLHLWRILANILGQLNSQSKLLTSNCLNRYVTNCSYWSTTILSDDDLGECDAYPIVYEIKSQYDHLATMEGNRITERMKSWCDFLNFDAQDSDSFEDLCFEELLIMLSGKIDDSSCYSNFIAHSSSSLNVSITKKSFPAYAIWYLSKNQNKKIENVKYPFFQLGKTLLELLSFQIVASAWLKGPISNFVIKGVQVIVQHAYLEHVENDSIYKPAHSCLKYLQHMNIDILQCTNKAFERGISCQDETGMLLSMLEKSDNHTTREADTTKADTISNLPQLQSTGQKIII